MTTPSHRDATPGEATPASDDCLSRFDRAVAQAREALSPLLERGRTATEATQSRPDSSNCK